MRPDDDLEAMKIAESSGEESSSSIANASVSSDSAKIIVADTSPLNYLVQIECDYLLPVLYRRVITAPVVVAGLTHLVRRSWSLPG